VVRQGRPARDPLKIREELTSDDYLDLITRLLQRCRRSDPTGGVWEAADLQWWWRRVRPSDRCGQLFWLDEVGDPVAAVVLTDWDRAWTCDVIIAPEHVEALFDLVWQRGLEQVAALELDAVEVRARDDDTTWTSALDESGFAPAGDASTATWLDAGRRPQVSPLPRGFRLLTRTDTADRAHHMIGRNGEHVAERLAECSLYDAELDLLVEAPDGDVAAYALFWPDPVTRVGLVEPMRTESEYQRLGLARHLLTAGLERLAARGCERFKVSHNNDNPAARCLYIGAGFVPDSISYAYARRSP
jgi:GNAT superfamily N-acetyltransferase